jgi:hypothetical protein
MVGDLRLSVSSMTIDRGMMDQAYFVDYALENGIIMTGYSGVNQRYAHKAKVHQIWSNGGNTEKVRYHYVKYDTATSEILKKEYIDICARNIGSIRDL